MLPAWALLQQCEMGNDTSMGTVVAMGDGPCYQHGYCCSNVRWAMLPAQALLQQWVVAMGDGGHVTGVIYFDLCKI